MSVAETHQDEKTDDRSANADDASRNGVSELTPTPSPSPNAIEAKFRWRVLLAFFLVPILLATGLYVAVITSSQSGSESAAESITIKPIRVGITRVGAVPPPKLATRFRGLVMPRRESALAFRRSGPVQSVLVDAGDVLKAGDTIAVLDASDLDAQSQLADSELSVAQAEYDEAIAGPRKQTISAAGARVDQLESQLQAARNRLKRREKLLASRAVSIEEMQDERQLVDQLIASVDEADSQLRELLEGTRSEKIQAAKARVDMAKASRRVIDVQMNDSRIVAPFDCVISQRFIDEGTIASPDQTIVRIVEQPPLEASFGIPANTAALLTVGETVLISVGKNADAIGELPTLDDVRETARGRQATIVRMQPRVDPVTRTREVVVQFDTDELALLGQPAALWIEWSKLQSQESSASKTNDQFWIPSDALVRSVRGLWAIYIAQPDASVDSENEIAATVSLRDAKIIKTAGSMTLVAANVTVDDWIIVEGTQRVGPGVTVTGVRSDERAGNESQ